MIRSDTVPSSLTNLFSETDLIWKVSIAESLASLFDRSLVESVELSPFYRSDPVESVELNSFDPI